MTVPLGLDRVLFDNGEGGVGYLFPYRGFTGAYLVEQIRNSGSGNDFIGNKEVRIIPYFQMPDTFFLYAAELVDFNTHKSHVRINMDRAKVRAHKWRRRERSREMQPFDYKISCQIPGEVADAEMERVRLREKYRIIQERIDACTKPSELKPIMRSLIHKVRKHAA